MAGGALISEAAGGEGKNYEGGVTVFVVITCIVAAVGGLLFGYDIGISGGVTSMEEFLSKFFPEILEKMNDKSVHDTQYCKYDNQLLTLFTSSLYIAALLASFLASTVTRVFGRKVSMFCGGVSFLAGALLNGFAANLEMLIIGRLLLGVGVGFANQSVPVYLSEMAPARVRGALNIGFQMAITVGILTANLVNYATARISGGWGWRLSLGLAGVPAATMTVGSLFLSDTTNSILERGHTERAKKMLQRIRGTANVDAEFHDLVEASEAAKKMKHPWRNIVRRRYRPQLVLCVLVPFFQQITGINVIMFYAPVLFKTLGFADDASLMSAVITGSVICGGTVVSIFCVDRFGRKALFLEGGLQMVISQIAVGSMIAWKYGTNGQNITLTKTEADILVFLISAFVAAFAWSWGPLGWLVPSEICPLEIRSAGQAINVSVNMLFTALIAQGFLPMLCRMKFGLFFFFAGFVLIMTVFVMFFLPETKNVPIEEINKVWKEHWFWRKYIPDDDMAANKKPNVEN